MSTAIEWIQETINAGVELAKEHPVAAAAVGVTVAAGVGYAGYRICKKKKSEKLIEGEVVATPIIKDPLSITAADIDAIANATVAKLRAQP